MNEQVFLPTLIQTSSTIVSLLGAILISRLIEFENEFQATKNKLEEKIVRWLSNVENQNWIGDTHPTETPTEYVEKFRGLKILAKKIRFNNPENLSSDIEKLLEYAQVFEENKTRQIIIDLNICSASYDNACNVLIPEMRQLRTECMIYYRRLRAKDFWYLFYILVLTSTTGTIIPIFFLTDSVWKVSTIFVICNGLVLSWFGHQLYKFSKENSLRIPNNTIAKG